ncbi:MAG: SpoIIE family protein phosphatase [Saprospiraceae bacterium]|nr:SpoIIE family protein phosphatase [Saprospiraceae bacterium]
MEREKSLTLMPESELLRNAANASSEGITISVMSAPDRPLIFVNQGFQTLTGYSRKEAMGRNCRFLQGDATDPLSVQALREAIAKGESCTVELINYRKDGTPFWNRLSITPIRDHRNIVTHYVGIQSDITLLRETKVRLEAANKDLEVFQERVLKELERAKLAQQFLLPTELPTSTTVRFASLFVPMQEIGGDFYDVIELPNEKYGLLMADVTGHGLPAALLTFMSSTTFKNAVVDCSSPARCIGLTNERLFRKMPDDAFVTMFYAVFDSENHKLTYVQAGHPEGYIIRSGTKEILPLRTGGTLVGAFSADEVNFIEKEIDIEAGDKVVLYTDAITDILDRCEDAQETEFISFLQAHADLSLESLFNRIYDFGLTRGKLTTYPDDFTLLGMEVLQ